MKRRDAIRNIALASAATMFLPGCSDKNVIEFVRDNRLILNTKHMDYLSAISEVFLPVKGVSDKIDPPADFIMRMVNDTWAPEAIVKFAEGFEQYKLLMKATKTKIIEALPDEVIAQVEVILSEEEPKEEVIRFINSVRQLSIHNFTSSEYYMVNHADYQMIPPPYEACITL